jgi:hypothetical protein
MFRSFLLAVLFAVSAHTHALLIEYNLTDLGGSQYQYDYTVTNDGSIASNISLFSINFDIALYDEASLTPILSSDVITNWDLQVLASSLFIPAALDFFALGSGLDVGESFSGVSIEFTWLDAASLPNNQSFDVFDANTFDFLGSGMTSVISQPNPVPAPLTISFMLVGVIWIITKRLSSKSESKGK